MNDLNAYNIVGVPGSGKSTIAKKMVEEHRPNGASLSEADDYFEVHNKEFSVELLGEAHDYSQTLYHDACYLNVPLVINSNTNTTVEEIIWYLDTAKLFRYTVNIVFVRCPVEVAHARNIHNVPLETVQRYHENIIALEPELRRIDSRLHKGWIFSELNTNS